jgi:hypothetical protein
MADTGIKVAGETVHLLDTELQVVLQAVDAYSIAYGPDEVLRQRARKKIAAALELAQRPYKGKGQDETGK